MPMYVEVWCEKDALAGVLMEETEPYDVPLMVAKGYASISFLHSAAEAIEAKGKPAYIHHFGDLDPSGVDAARDIEVKLRRYAPSAEIHFERHAVTREQVEQWNSQLLAISSHVHDIILYFEREHHIGIKHALTPGCPSREPWCVFGRARCTRARPGVRRITGHLWSSEASNKHVAELTATAVLVAFCAFPT
jgi:hypothetical protein